MADYVLGVEITGDASGLQKAAGEASKALGGVQDTASKTGSGAAQSFAQQLGGGIKDASKQIGEFGKSMTILTAPITAFGAKGTQSFLEVDKTMQLANKTMGNTAEQAGMLQSAMEQAASNSTFGMQDAAKASLNFARAGLNAEQAAAALAPAMNLAAGEGGNLDTVSAGLTATINGFGDSFENAGHYSDVFAAACNNSALDVDGLASSMNVAAPVFAAAGKDVEDAALYMGVMANAGYDASTAANSLKTGMARLAKPAKEASDAMDQYLGGWSAFNSDGTMKSSLQIQKELHDSFSNLSEQEQMAAASAIFGKNQMAPWLALINTAPDDVNALSDSLENCEGTTQEMADTMMDGAGGSVEKLKSSLDVLGTKFGEIISTALIPMADNVQKIVDWFLSLDSGTQQLIGTFAMIIAVIGPLAITIGLVGGAIGNLITIFGAISAPVLVVVGVITLLVGAFIYLWNTNEEFRTRVMEIWNALVASFMEYFAQIKEILDGMGINAQSLQATWELVWEAISRALLVAFDLIQGTISFALDYIMGLFHIFHGLLTGDWNEMWDGIKQILSGALDFIKALFHAGCDALGIDAGALKEDIKEKFTEIKEKVIEKVTQLKEKAIEIWENLKESVGDKVGDIRDSVEEGFNDAVDYITSLPGQAYDWGADIIESIADGIWGAIGSVTSAVSSVADTIWSYLHFSEPETGSLSRFHTWMPDMMKGLADGMKNNLPTLRAGVELVANEMTGVMPGTGTAGRYDGGDSGGVHNTWGGVNIVVNAAEGQDEEAIANAVMRRMMDLVAAEV